MKEKIIVTGGAGWIGSYLCRALKDSGHEVFVIDRKLGNEVSDILSLDPSSISALYHLAATSAVCNSDVDSIRRDNIEAFRIICDFSRDHSIPLIYASSATAYEKNTSTFYGESKRLNEEYALSTNPEFSHGCRLHNVLGPESRPGTIIYALETQDHIILQGGGLGTRHFTWIDDIVAGLIWAGKTQYPLVNIYNTEETSLLDLALEVQKYKPLKIETSGDLELGDRMKQYVDLSLPSYPGPYLSVAEGVKKIYGKN